MEFLDKTGVQTLWNKIKSGFVGKVGAQTISGTLTASAYNTTGYIKTTSWLSHAFACNNDGLATSAYHLYCNHDSIYLAYVPIEDFGQSDAVAEYRYWECYQDKYIALANGKNTFNDSAVKLMDSTSVITKTAAAFINSALTVDSTGAYAKAFYESSDERLKENIQPITEETIAKAASVEIRQFNFKKDENKTAKYGVIAQEVEKEGLANLVSVNGDDGLKSVDYTSLLCLKIKALEAKLEKMEKELQELKNK